MIAILIFFLMTLLILLLSINVHIYFKSAGDTWKVVTKIAFFHIRIPHQRLIEKMLAKEKTKTYQEKKEDFKKTISSNIWNELAKHSSLERLYIAKFSRSDLYCHPLSNAAYLIVSNQIRGYVSAKFRRVAFSNIELRKDPSYENIDYYIAIKTDVINLILVLFKVTLKGDRHGA